MARYAIIDIGTNSIKFHIAEKNDAGKWTVVLDTAEIARLGEGLRQSGKINEEAMDRNIAAISGMLARANKENVDQVVAVGTMALRTASNADDFVEKVKSTCGITVEIIPGEEEARLSYVAIRAGVGLSEGKLVIFDTGGGSTEFVFGKGEEIEKRYSLNVGAVQYTEQILQSDPVTDNEYTMAVEAIENDLAKLNSEANADALVGMGGTMTSLAAVRHEMAVYNPEVIQGSKLELADIERLIKMFKSKTIEERKQVVGLQPKRADVILAGAIIARTIMKKLGADYVTISDHGLRHGLIVDRFK